MREERWLEQNKTAFLRAGRAPEKATSIATTTENVDTKAKARAKADSQSQRATNIVLNNNRPLSLARTLKFLWQ
ncbi:MAG TPA: hypothetical protein VEG44_08295 [Candidatus Acidoferrales bacterium]|nr:hypothetical protein [Candidatus Acidoferrales bacterium]